MFWTDIGYFGKIKLFWQISNSLMEEWIMSNTNNLTEEQMNNYAL